MKRDLGTPFALVLAVFAAPPLGRATAAIGARSQPGFPPPAYRAYSAAPPPADPAARSVLDAEREVYTNLSSYRVTFRETHIIPSTMGVREYVTEDSRILFRRPGFFRMETQPDSPISGTITSNGVHLYTTGQFARGRYHREPAPRDILAMMRSHLFFPSTSPSAVAWLLKTGIPNIASLHAVPTKQLPDVMIDGRSYHLLMVALPEAPHPVEVRLAIDPQTHLLRRAIMEFLPRGGPALRWDLTDQQVNPVLDPKLFAFVPPKDPLAGPARMLLREMEAAYRRVHSFQAVIAFSRVDHGHRHDYRSRFALRRPDQVADFTRSSTGTMQVVSNGRQLYRYNSANPNTYTREPLAGQDLDTIVIPTEDDPGGSLLLDLFGRGDHLEELAQGLEAAEVQGHGVVNGSPVTWILLHMKNSPTEFYTIRLGVGRTDHLLRSMVSSAAGVDSSITVTLSDVRVNQSLPASTFQFVPPRGARLQQDVALEIGR